jgi:ribonuclease PH
MSKSDPRENTGILVLRHSDEKREIEFELNFLSSLNLSQRFLLMETKIREIKSNLIKNGHRETPQIIKRK